MTALRAVVPARRSRHQPGRGSRAEACRPVSAAFRGRNTSRLAVRIGQDVQAGHLGGSGDDPDAGGEAGGVIGAGALGLLAGDDAAARPPPDQRLDRRGLLAGVRQEQPPGKPRQMTACSALTNQNRVFCARRKDHHMRPRTALNRRSVCSASGIRVAQCDDADHSHRAVSAGEHNGRPLKHGTVRVMVTKAERRAARERVSGLPRMAAGRTSRSRRGQRSTATAPARSTPMPRMRPSTTITVPPQNCGNSASPEAAALTSSSSLASSTA